MKKSINAKKEYSIEEIASLLETSTTKVMEVDKGLTKSERLLYKTKNGNFNLDFLREKAADIVPPAMIPLSAILEVANISTKNDRIEDSPLLHRIGELLLKVLKV